MILSDIRFQRHLFLTLPHCASLELLQRTLVIKPSRIYLHKGRLIILRRKKASLICTCAFCGAVALFQCYLSCYLTLLIVASNNTTGRTKY